MYHGIRTKERNKGFSMVELIIVVAIMAVLAGVLAPMLITHLQKTKRTRDVASADEIKKGFERAVVDNLIADDSNVQGNTAAATIPVSYQYNNPPTDILDAVFLELGGVPTIATDKNYNWYIIYNPRDNTVTEIYLTDPNDSSVKHELYPNSDKFLDMK